MVNLPKKYIFHPYYPEQKSQQYSSFTTLNTFHGSCEQPCIIHELFINTEISLGLVPENC